jgi:A/G-specific adenine glycosylase
MESIESRTYYSKHLLEWYNLNKRDLPWRRSRNPYHIWVSEIMLQQTRVETVIPYFHRFIERFPTVEALSDASEEAVLKAWEGLGYYSRARNLQAAVREVRTHYGSVVPHEKEQISALKGVGPYTAGAILSIAYNKPEPAVDGNVMRVLARFFLIQDDISKTRTRQRIEKLAQELIPSGAAGDFNQALMELGAVVCTPKSPNCLTCPVMRHCQARLAGLETVLPIKKKAKPPRVERRLAAWIEGSGRAAGKFLIRRRPQQGLLAGMWELPHYLVNTLHEDDETLHARNMEYLSGQLSEVDGIRVRSIEWFMNTEHTFSHIHWNMQVYRCLFIEPQGRERMGNEFGEYRWIDPQELAHYAFPNVFLRIINVQK